MHGASYVSAGDTVSHKVILLSDASHVHLATAVDREALRLAIHELKAKPACCLGGKSILPFAGLPLGIS